MKFELNTPIEEMDFAYRTNSCLVRAGVETLGDICSFTADELREVRNLGPKNYAEVVKAVESAGFSLASTSHSAPEKLQKRKAQRLADEKVAMTPMYKSYSVEERVDGLLTKFSHLCS